MSATTGWAQRLDAQITTFFSTWSLTTTLLVILTTALLILPLFLSRDPDLHPFLLARQSNPAPVRQPGESAVYRALDVQFGAPLKRSLGVKDVGGPKWGQGRKGDLRDVWRRAACGPLTEDGGRLDASKRGGLVVVLGRERVVKREWEEGTRMINALGEEVRKWGVKRVGVCLANSVELLVCIFAAAFSGFEVVLLPYGLEQERLEKLLKDANVEALIVEAGSIDLDSALKSVSGIKQLVLVTTEGNKHMDWTDTPAAGANVQILDDIVQASKASTDVPAVEKGSETPSISSFVGDGKGDYELVSFTSENLVSGTVGLGSTLVRDQKMTSSDIVLPTVPLTESHALCWTLAALYSNSSVALNSVAGDKVDLALAAAGVNPTIIIAAPGTVENYVYRIIKSGGGPGSIGRYFATKSLKAGVMPGKPSSTAMGPLSHLRLILIGQPAGSKPKLTSATLHELRQILGTRVGYAFTTPRVAGAISQSNVLDYRDKGIDSTAGPPLGSVEINVQGPEDMSVSSPRGNLVVKGPSVVGGRVELDHLAQIDGDNTLKMF